jgi:hypothetical protein
MRPESGRTIPFNGPSFLFRDFHARFDRAFFQAVCFCIHVRDARPPVTDRENARGAALHGHATQPERRTMTSCLVVSHLDAAVPDVTVTVTTSRALRRQPLRRTTCRRRHP